MAFKGFEALYRLFWFKGTGQARIMRILVEATGLVLMQPGTAFPTPLRSLLDKAFRLKDGDQINPRTIDDAGWHRMAPDGRGWRSVEFRYLMITGSSRLTQESFMRLCVREMEEGKRIRQVEPSLDAQPNPMAL
ncbi:hypothetical protein EV361DRAFT_1033976 [Lentinula raphanica]|nr:hypothetical protein F5880DRAFT_1508188 [Lentinula raphanica]KAJ3971102.1 hypothetical protein EV361DRAFT_1033976 [Lentinula raphanica]